MRHERSRGPSPAIRAHIRGNLVGYLALFCFVVGGTASALPGRNSVTSNDIRTNAVKKRQIDERRLDYGAIQARVSGSCAVGEAIRSVSSTGSVGCEAIGGAGPVGPAGGGLAGSYPDPTIAANAIGPGQLQPNAVAGGPGGDLADNTVDANDVSNSGGGALTGADINEGQLAFTGRTARDVLRCENAQFGKDCATQTLTVPANQSSRVLLIGSTDAAALSLGPNGTAWAICFFRVDNNDSFAGNHARNLTTALSPSIWTMESAVVTPPLAAGQHEFDWRCAAPTGAFSFNQPTLTAVLLGAT